MNRKSGEIFSAFKAKMASPAAVIDEAFRSLPTEETSSDYIKTNFSRLVDYLQDTAYAIYRTHETKMGTEVLLEYFGFQEERVISVPIKLEQKVSNLFVELNDFFLSLSQSRKSRAGDAFEAIIKRLFKELAYPFDEQIVINGKPDFLLPGEFHWKVHATDCIIFTLKRTLRERWRQIVTEGVRGLGFYLATIDEKISGNALEEMRQNRIYLVVPAKLKNQLEHYKSALNVLSFETFFRQHLDPAMKRWKENGVI